MQADPSPPVNALDAVQQLVLRGDGLTTTSLETLTGREVGIQLVRQYRAVVTADGISEGDEAGYTGVAFDDDRALAGQEHLDTRRGEELLVRRVHLTDRAATVYGVGEVVAVVDRLPDHLVTVLLHARMPLGKALAAHDVPVRRELRRWGSYGAGAWAAALGVRDGDEVLGRTYRMVDVSRGVPLIVITEWFAPRLWELVGAPRPPMGRPRNPLRAGR